MTEWLASLGLFEYAQRFAENDNDATVLRHLTDQDLKEIGVLLGHRRKILPSIAELVGAAPTRSQPAAPLEPKPCNDAERRQLTVMFADLVGSTALSTKLDPQAHEDDPSGRCGADWRSSKRLESWAALSRRSSKKREHCLSRSRHEQGPQELEAVRPS